MQSTNFWVNRNNRNQQKNIYRVLRVKLGLKNRTAKMLSHEIMTSYRDNLAYGYSQPMEVANDSGIVRFEFVVK